MSDLKKLVAQFMSELAKFEATTAQAPIAADEFSPEELADLTKVRNMGAKIRAKIAATAKPNAEMLAKSAAPEKNSESFEEIYQNYLNDCASGNLTHEKFEVHKKNLQAIVTTEKKGLDDLEQDTPSNSETIAATKAQIAKHEKAISDMSFENCVTCDFKYKVTDEVAVWNPSKKCWEANRTIEYCGASEKIWQMENIHQGGQKPTQNSKPERGIKSRNATEFEGKDAHTTIRKAKNLKTKGEKISHILTWETIEVLPQDSPKKTKALKLPLIFVQGSCENSSVLKGDPAPYLSWFAKEKIPNGSTIRVSCITNNHRTGVLGQVTLDNFVKDLKQIHPNYTFIADYENSNFENDLSKPQSYEVILEVEK